MESRSLTLQKQISRYAPIHLEPEASLYFSYHIPLAIHFISMQLFFLSDDYTCVVGDPLWLV
jgi:hypothetical protein